MLPCEQPNQLLLELLEKTAQKLDISIRYERIKTHDKALDTSDGGFCSIRGKKIIFIDPRAPLAQKCEIFKKAILSSDTSQIFLPPLVRSYVKK